MDRLRAGIALYNAGHYLAAHEPLEARWLESPAGEREDCLQGLIQATAAVHKSRTGNLTGASGLADSALGYLDDCGRVDVDPLSEWLGRLAADPELGTREGSPEIRLGGEVVTVDDLRFPAAGAAARALAETRGDEVVSTAVEYATADLESGVETSPFVTLTLDYLRGGEPIVRQRLKEHVERRRMRDSDVEGLF
jgi:hypothetical protein